MRLSRHSSNLLKIGVSLLFVIWLATIADFEKVTPLLLDVGFGVMGLAVIFHIASFVLGAARWWLLLQATGTSVSFWSILPVYYLGAFFNATLPTGVGGDAIRTIYLTRRGMDLKALIASAIMDRFLGLVALVAFVGCGSLFLPESLLTDTQKAGIAVAALFLTGLLLALISRSVLQRLGEKSEGSPRTWLKHIHAIGEVWLRFSQTPKTVLVALILSVLNQLFVIAAYIALGSHLVLPLAVTDYLVIIPLVFLAANAPISVGGLGVRETALVSLLLAYGAAKEAAVALSLLYLAAYWLSLLPGLIALMHKPAPAPAPHA